MLWYPRETAAGNPHPAEEAAYPLPGLACAAAGLGHINISPDPDGIIRRVALVYKYKGGYIPSLAFLMVCDYLRVQPADITLAWGRYILLKGAFFPGNLQGDIRIPINHRGEVRINFAGPWQDSFYGFSAESILACEKEPAAQARLREQMEGALILVSDISVRNNDKSTGVFDPVYPDSELHSSVINMILTSRFVRESGPALPLFTSLLPAIMSF